MRESGFCEKLQWISKNGGKNFPIYSLLIVFTFIIPYKAFVLALNELNARSDSEVFISALIYDSCSDTLAEHVRTNKKLEISV